MSTAPLSSTGAVAASEPPSLKPYLAIAATGQPLTAEQAQAAFDIIMDGHATAAQIGGLLMALRVRGETVEEIAGAVRSMRARMVRTKAPTGAVDVCGTGGDMAGTVNVSTAAAFIVAACGVPVAKHGNKALSSRAGSADVLAALEVKLDVTPETVARCIEEAGVGFMFAPRHHGAMKHVGPARAELAIRTVFNLLGPMSNPADATRQLIGVFNPQWLEPMARALGDLGTERAWLVHGSDGLDELTVTGPSDVVALENGRVTRFTVRPEELGLTLADPRDLKGGDAQDNAAALRALLDGATGAYRDIACLNAAAALVVAGKVRDLTAGLALAREAVDSGAAADRLTRLVTLTQQVEAVA